MGCFVHTGDDYLEVIAGAEIRLDRVPANPQDLVRAYTSRACDRPQEHREPSQEALTMPISARLNTNRTFKRVGVCCEEDGQRRAYYVCPLKQASFDLL